MSLACDVTGFYPPDISVRWLRVKENESEEDITDGAELWGPLQTLPRTFRAKALLKDLREMAREAEIVCRVMHCSLLKPIHRVWRNTRICKTTDLSVYLLIYLYIYALLPAEAHPPSLEKHSYT